VFDLKFKSILKCVFTYELLLSVKITYCRYTNSGVMLSTTIKSVDIQQSFSKAVPLHAMKAPGGEEYSSYSFSTSALDGVNGQPHAPAALYNRVKDPRYQLYRRLGGPQARGKSLASAEDRTSIARFSSP
jgi:hypothetical protein